MIALFQIYLPYKNWKQTSNLYVIDIRGKGYLKTNAKYFIVDNGLRRLSAKKGKIMPIA